MRPEGNRISMRDLRALAEGFLAEDVGRGDRTTEAVVPSGMMGRARIEMRDESPALVGGLDAARACFEVADQQPIGWEAARRDGDRVHRGDVVAVVEAWLGAVLVAERTALNLLCRLSGVATHAARFVAAVEGTPARVIDTRKTTPGLRVLEKHAVRLGGASNHRFGLDDGILVKDNHIAAAGTITEAVARVTRDVSHALRVEVEVEDLAGLDEAVSAGADAVLLDNFDPDHVREAVGRAGGKVLLEASGGITLENVRAYAETGVDLISVGALTHSAPSVDFALEVER